MRRFLVLVCLLCFAVPFGASIAGCGSKTVTQYCNGGDSGPTVGQVASISLPTIYVTYGISVDYAQVGPGLSASAVDCKGNTVSVRSYTYATTNMSFADINPFTGQVCGGMWNRNSGGGIADYTTCNPPTPLPTIPSPVTPLIAFVTATANGAVSNAVPVYVHPVVTSIVIGSPTATASCASSTDPSTNCCPSFNVLNVANPYDGSRCLSQGEQAQLTARVYAGSVTPANNITCQVGHVNFAGQNGAIFTVDQNGVLTAEQPGSTIVTASVTNSGTGGAAGFFSTCPPASIKLAVASTGYSGPNPVPVPVNSVLPLSATVVDTRGVTITGTNLTYLSTTPTTISAAGGSLAPTFPGAATITAVCQPPTCNPAPFSQIGLFGNGKPITSNGINDVTTGTNATVLYIASTQSQYLLPIDFSNSITGTAVKLPYSPNSMVITQDGSTIYLGSTTALMTVSATSNALTGASTAIPGTVLSVSPDGSIVVVTDPNRQTVSLVSGGSVVSTYGGVGTHAQWSPDSATVYITTNTNVLLTHSTFTGWNSNVTSQQYNDLTVAVPSVGAFFAGPTTQGRTYCSTSTPVAGTSNPVAETNVAFPVASDTAARTDHVAATNDGNHILGVTATPAPTLNDIAVSIGTNTPVTATQPNGPLACTTATGPVTFTTLPTPHALTGITATAVTGVVPSSNSAVAFVTYTGSSSLLPLYVPATGTLSNVTLSGAATAPVAGVFSTDNATFFAGTSGDNAVHRITVTGTTAVDTPANVITPLLPGLNGGTAVPDLLVQRPKRATS